MSSTFRTLTSMLTSALLLSVALPTLAQVPPPPPPPPPPPAVSGPPVMIDAAGTSVLAGTVVAADGSDRAVRRALVIVRGSGMPERMLLSDDEGHFAFTGLPAGTYSLSVSKPAWLTGYYGAREPWKAPGIPVALGDGERRTDLELRLTPGAVISGRLVDEFGLPLAGARVFAFQRRRLGGQDTFTATGPTGYGVRQLTNDRGEFRLFQLPPGEFIIGANVAGGVTSARSTTTIEEVRWVEQARRGGVTGASAPPSRGPSVGYLPVYHPGVADPRAATIVRVGIGEERSGMDFAVRLVPSVTISGTLSTPDGQPAAGVPLVVLSPGKPVAGTMLLFDPSGRITRSRPDGSFAIYFVTPGDHLLVARGASQSPGGRGGGTGTSSTMLWADRQISVANRDIDGLTIQLQPGLTISGRLAFAGTTLEPPARLDRVTIGVLPEDGGAISIRVPPVSARADGTFEIGGLAPGRYILTASVAGAPGRGRGGAAWLAHRAAIDGRNALERPFAMSAGRDIDDLVVRFTDRPAELSGQVTDAAGRPVSGLTMVLFPVDPENWAVSADERARRTAPLDDAGRYRMSMLAGGDYYLAALAEFDTADLADPSFLEQAAAGAIRITLALGERKIQDVKVGG